MTDVLAKTLEKDPRRFDAWVELARIQNREGKHEKARANCESGLQQLVKLIAEMMNNDERNPILKTFSYKTEIDIAMEYAVEGALYLCVLDDDAERMVWPTGENAEKEERTEDHKGLYWVKTSLDGKQSRMFLPNFFNTFCNEFCKTLRENSDCSNMIVELGLALERLGETEESQKHIQKIQHLKQE